MKYALKVGETRIIGQENEISAEIGRLDQSGYKKGELKTYSGRIIDDSSTNFVLYEDEDNNYQALKERMLAEFNKLKAGHP